MKENRQLNTTRLKKESCTGKLLSSSMLESKNSQCVGYRDIQSDVSIAVWKNQCDQVVTNNKGVHTLSLYLEGGVHAYRTDMKHLHGGPNKVCFMPAGFQSVWNVDDPLKLVHLYFTESHLHYLGLTAFDIDPRLLQLQDITYAKDEQLMLALKGLLIHMDNADGNDKLAMQESQQKIILYLLQHYSHKPIDRINGGLSGSVKARTLDYIEEHLGSEMHLNDLANIACLSTYHFARMFKKTTGLSPYQYILKRRMEVAAEYLKQGDDLLSVALRCGYASHSRLARAFRGTYGVTPSEYQKLFDR